MTQPWFRDYLHPALEEFFRPNVANHGSYFLNWTSTDEAFWKENYHIWMHAVKDFEQLGGLVGAGDDAGFIYRLYGFALIRELELHQETGRTGAGWNGPSKTAVLTTLAKEVREIVAKARAATPRK
jgi:hypothetical protein